MESISKTIVAIENIQKKVNRSSQGSQEFKISSGSLKARLDKILVVLRKVRATSSITFWSPSLTVVLRELLDEVVKAALLLIALNKSTVDVQQAEMRKQRAEEFFKINQSLDRMLSDIAAITTMENIPHLKTLSTSAASSSWPHIACIHADPRLLMDAVLLKAKDRCDEVSKKQEQTFQDVVTLLMDVSAAREESLEIGKAALFEVDEALTPMVAQFSQYGLAADATFVAWQDYLKDIVAKNAARQELQNDVDSGLVELMDVKENGIPAENKDDDDIMPSLVAKSPPAEPLLVGQTFEGYLHST